MSTKPTPAQAAARQLLLDKAEARGHLHDEAYMSLPTVAAMLGLSREHVGRMIEAGCVLGFNVGLGSRRKWLIKLSDVRRYLESKSSDKGL